MEKVMKVEHIKCISKYLNSVWYLNSILINHDIFLIMIINSLKYSK